METIEDHSASDPTVNYDEAPVAEIEIEGLSYRVDAGRGSSIAISTREPGTYTWTFVKQGQWDGVRLKAKGLGHVVVDALGRTLAQVTRDDP